MIPVLLWRCPLCSTIDALSQRRRFLRPDELSCSHCGAVWHVRRVVGDDYWLKVIAAPTAPAEVGKEWPLAQWYDRVKQMMKLAPVTDPALAPAGPIALEAEERLYLASKKVLFRAESDDPLFFPAAAGDNKGARPQGAPPQAPVPGNPMVSGDKRGVVGIRVGAGRLFLTNRRLIWQGEDGQRRDFTLDKLNSAYAAFNISLVLMYGMRLYDVRFAEESLLKWVTYMAFVAREVKATTGRVLATSNY